MSTTASPAVPCIVQELKQQKREAEKLNVGSLCAFAAYVLNVFAEKWVNRKELGKIFRESEMNRSRVSENLSSKPKNAESDSPESGFKLRGTSWRRQSGCCLEKTKDTKSRQIAMNMVSLCLIHCKRTYWWMVFEHVSKKIAAMQMWLIEEMLVASKFIGDERKEYEILILTGFERNSVLSVCLVAWRQAAQGGKQRMQCEMLKIREVMQGWSLTQCLCTVFLAGVHQRSGGGCTDRGKYGNMHLFV